jgi:hypothetical protein
MFTGYILRRNYFSTCNHPQDGGVSQTGDGDEQVEKSVPDDPKKC